MNWCFPRNTLVAWVCLGPVLRDCIFHVLGLYWKFSMETLWCRPLGWDYWSPLQQLKEELMSLDLNSASGSQTPSWSNCCVAPHRKRDKSCSSAGSSHCSQSTRRMCEVHCQISVAALNIRTRLPASAMRSTGNSVIGAWRQEGDFDLSFSKPTR